jgi:hypothetical protein
LHDDGFDAPAPPQPLDSSPPARAASAANAKRRRLSGPGLAVRVADALRAFAARSQYGARPRALAASGNATRGRGRPAQEPLLTIGW